MVEAFFGFKKTPFGDSPDAKQLFASQAWNQVKARLQFLVDHHGTGLLTGEVGAGKSTAARTFSAGLNPNLYKILYLHWTSGSGPTSADRPGTGHRAGPLPRRPGAPDLRSHRAPQPQQEAASHSDLR
jgi:hypothetical protein